MQLVIDRFINPRQKGKYGILQKSPVFPIFFLIYTSGMFSKIEKQLSDITYLSFINIFSFLIPNQSIYKIAKMLEKLEQITLE